MLTYSFCSPLKAFYVFVLYVYALKHSNVAIKEHKKKKCNCSVNNIGFQMCHEVEVTFNMFLGLKDTSHVFW